MTPLENEAGLRIIMLGVDDKIFPWTDRLSFSVQPKFNEWILTTREKIIIGEGDRLATKKTLYYAKKAGYETYLITIYGGKESEERRFIRAREFNLKLQNEKWVQGRKSKVKNLLNNSNALKIKGFLLKTGSSKIQTADKLGEIIKSLIQ